MIPRIDIHGPDKCPLTDDVQWYAGYVRLVADDFSWTWTEKDTDEERCRGKLDKLAERVAEQLVLKGDGFVAELRLRCRRI